MSATKHTSGSWGTAGDGRTLVGYDGLPLMSALRSETERSANRRLIAAAPDLLDACEYVASILAHHMDADERDAAMYALGAAIAKAKGGQS